MSSRTANKIRHLREQVQIDSLQQLLAIIPVFGERATGKDHSISHAKFLEDLANSEASSSAEKAEKKSRVPVPVESAPSQPSAWVTEILAPFRKPSGNPQEISNTTQVK